MNTILRLELDRAFIDLLAAKRFGDVGKLIRELGFLEMEGNWIKNPGASYERLERICYTVNYLETEGLVTVAKTSYGANKPDFNLDDIFKGGLSHLYERVEYYNDLLIEYWGKELRITFGFYKFVADGYKSNEERKEQIHFWLPIGVAVLSAFLTAIFTSLIR